jgi:tape measure domain-containing protein
MTVEEILIRINGDTSRGEAALNRITNKLTSFQNMLTGLAAGYSVEKLFEKIIGSNAEMEQNMAAFEVLLGGIDNAKARMDELVDYANKTPFSLPQVVTAEKRLLAFGVAAKDTAKILPALGDIAMGNAEKLNLISLAYGQVVTNQRLYGTELRQFAENGVPLLAELAKMYGVTEAKMREMVEDGEIGANTVTKAIMSMTSEGGKFFGMMDKQGKTFTGLWSTIKDNLEVFGRQIGAEVFDMLKSKQEEFMANWEKWSQDGTLKKAAGTISDVLKVFVDLLIKGIEFLAKHGKEVVAVIGAYVSLTAALKAVAIAQAAMNVVAMANPYVAIAAAITAVVGGLIAYSAANKEAERQTYETLNATRKEIDETENLLNKHEELSGKVNKTVEEKKDLHDIEVKLAELYPSSADGIDSQNQKYTTQIDLVKTLSEEKRKAYEAEVELMAIEGRLKLQNLQNDLKGLSANRDALIKERDQIKNTIGKNEELFNRLSSKLPAGPQGYVNPNDIELRVIMSKIKEDTGQNWDSFYYSMNNQIKRWKEINGLLVDLDKQKGEAEEKINTYNTAIAQSDMLKNPDEYNFNFSDAYTNMMAQKNKPAESNNEPLASTKKKKAYKNEPLENALRVLEHKKRLNQISLEDEVKTLQQIKAVHVKIATERMDIDEKIYEAQQAIKDRDFKQSVNWINEQKELGKLTTQQEIDAWQRVYDKQKGNIEATKEATKNLYSLRKQLQDEALQNSVNWINEQKDLGKLSAQEEIAAWERVYTKQKDNINAVKEASKNLYRLKKDLADKEEKENKERLEKMVNEYIDAKRKEIEAEYDAMDEKEKTADREKKLSELRTEEEKFRNAITKEGKDRLKEIQKDIAEIEKDEAKDKRDAEKKAKLDALEEEQKSMLSAVERFSKNSNSLLTTADQTLKDALLNATKEFNTKQDSFISEGLKKLRTFVDNYKSIAAELTTGAFSGNTPAIAGAAAGGTTYNIKINNNNNIADKTSAEVYAKTIKNDIGAVGKGG